MKYSSMLQYLFRIQILLVLLTRVFAFHFPQVSQISHIRKPFHLYATSIIPSTSTTFPIDDDTPYPSGSYNATESAKYFKSRRLLLTTRTIELGYESASFGIGLLSDYLRNILFDPKQETKRAIEFTNILTRLGPSFIKLGQSLSIRKDLLRPIYATALSSLQDKVPSFSTLEARNIIESTLHNKIENIFLSGNIL